MQAICGPLGKYHWPSSATERKEGGKNLSCFLFSEELSKTLSLEILKSKSVLSHALPTVVLFFNSWCDNFSLYSEVILYLRRLLCSLITSCLPSVEVKQINV